MTTSQAARGTGYQAAEKRRLELLSVADRLAVAATALQLAELAKVADTTSTRLESDAFFVTVLGDFKRGKSTLMNAMLGEKVLPSFSWPCTAVLTEVRWGQEKSALLYPRRDKRGRARRPVPVDVTDLERSITIDSERPDLPSKYERAEVRWPLELCRNNVVLVDSPGLNEDPIRERITLDYLARTDAVIFVQDAQANMSMSEAHFVKTYLDAHQPFFVYNKINLISPDEVSMVKTAAQARLRAVRPEHVDDDAARAFWINAKAGVDSKIFGDLALWEQSNMETFTRRLETFLAKERHKVKILVPARQLSSLCYQLSKSLFGQQEMLNKDLSELQQKYADAQLPLQTLTTASDNIVTRMRNGVSALISFVQDSVHGQLQIVANSVTDWAVSAVPDSKLTRRPWKSKENAEALSKEVAEITMRRVEEAFAHWVSDELEPAIERRLKDVQNGITTDLAGFERGIEAIRLDLTGITGAMKLVPEGQSPTSWLFAGVEGMPSAGSRSNLAGFGFTPRDFTKTLLPTLAVGLVWLFTPVGLPLVVVALVGQALFKAVPAVKGAEKRIKEQIGKELAAQLRSNSYPSARSAAEQFATELAEFQNSVEEGLSAQVRTLRREVQTVLDTKTSGEAAVERRRTELDELDEELNEVGEELSRIVLEIAEL